MEEIEDTDVGVAVEVQPLEPEETPTSTEKESLLEMLSSDSRVGHFIVDVLHGVNADEACLRYFPTQTVDTETLVREAEERGYMRGRNESIEDKMNKPDVWQSPSSEAQSPNNRVEILSHIRRSVWD